MTQPSIPVPVQHFSVPDRVWLELPVNTPRSTTNPSLSLQEVPVEVLAQLCDEFRKRVFEKAGKADPAMPTLVLPPGDDVRQQIIDGIERANRDLGRRIVPLEEKEVISPGVVYWGGKKVTVDGVPLAECTPEKQELVMGIMENNPVPMNDPSLIDPEVAKRTQTGRPRRSDR